MVYTCKIYFPFVPMTIAPLRQLALLLTVILGFGIFSAGAQLGETPTAFPYGAGTAQTNPGAGLRVGLETLENKIDEDRSGIIKEDNLRTVIVNWTSFFLQYYMVVAVGLLIYFGVRLILSRGAEEERKKLIQALINLAIGTLIIFLSYVIVNQIVSLVAPGAPAQVTTRTTGTPASSPAP